MTLLLALACVSAENYGHKSVNLYCDRLYECNKSDFESAYDDMADCIESNLEDSEALYTCAAEECEFDAEKARSCLSDVAAASCDDWLEESIEGDCGEVYDDCDKIDFATCLAD